MAVGDSDPLQLKRTRYKPVNSYDLLKEIQASKLPHIKLLLNGVLLSSIPEERDN
jgi:hypothetical protein